MSGPIQVAIIGAGIGREHLHGYLQVSDRFSVQTICDLDRERAASLIADHSHITVETDFEQVLANPQIDLVDICLPPHLHFSASKAALETGKYVVCEKPLATSLREVDELEKTARKCRRSLTPVFQYRYGPAVEQLRALIEAELTGRAFTANIETHWNRSADYYAIGWRGTWEGENGGAVLNHAIHNHDLLCYIMGPVASLSAVTATRVNPIEVEDSAAIAFQMENGAVATSSITLGASQNTTRLRFCFEGLTAESGANPYAPADDAWLFTARHPVKQHDIDEVAAATTPTKSGFAGFFDALADALDGRGGGEVTFADGRRSIELVSAIYLASRTRATVELPLDIANSHYGGWSSSELAT
jgi:predicted dehydrogenase